jgi:hypothetical protein
MPTLDRPTQKQGNACSGEFTTTLMLMTSRQLCMPWLCAPRNRDALESYSPLAFHSCVLCCCANQIARTPVM